MNNQSFSEKLQSNLERFVVPFATKISSQRHLAAIRDGLTYLIPFTIIGGLSILLASPPISETQEASNFFIQFLLGWKAWATQNGSILMVPYNLTIGIISIYVVAGISYQLSKHYKMNSIANMLVATFVFATVSCAPGTFLNGEIAISAIPTANLGAASMFSAILIGIAVVEINHFLILKNIRIKLPDAVPENVSGPFEVLIPLVVSTIVIMGLDLLLIQWTGAGINRLVFTIFQPLLSASGSLPSILLISFITQLFWFFGIHGNNMVSAVLTPITTANIALNLEAYNANEPMKEIFAGSFNSIYGGWMTYIAILITLFIVAKSQQLRSIRTVAPVSTAFNVNEPLIFGIPTVLNIYTFFGISLSTLTNVTVAYLAMSSGLVGKMYLSVPWTTPAPIAAFLSTMDWKAVVLWFALLAVDVIIMIPFIRMYDKQLVKSEQIAEQ